MLLHLIRFYGENNLQIEAQWFSFITYVAIILLPETPPIAWPATSRRLPMGDENQITYGGLLQRREAQFCLT